MLAIQTLVFLLSANWTATDKTLTPFFWLTGTWETVRPNGSVRLETWEKKSDKLLLGQGLKVASGDTTILEYLRLEEQDQSIIYTPIVPDQNNGKGVAFALTRQEGMRFIFENPAHDFPQRITYAFKPINRIAGLEQSKGDTIDIDVTSLNGEGIHFRFFRK